jgi:acylphosphatase
MNDVRANLIIRGMVQGVGFRYFAHRWAEKLQLHGWVKNTIEGAVETEVEGDRSAVEEYIEQMKLGPRWGHVSDVNVEYKPFEGSYHSFDITR